MNSERNVLKLINDISNLTLFVVDQSTLQILYCNQTAAKAGFKAFVLKDQLYLMGEVGAAFAVTNGYDKTSLLLSPAIGFATDKIDISLRYEHFNDFPVLKNGLIGDGLGQISLRLAYGFKI